jgi:hypothetical protein
VSLPGRKSLLGSISKLTFGVQNKWHIQWSP